MINSILGHHKRDEMSVPMEFDEEDEEHVNLSYLSAAKNIFIEWKKSGCSGLTDQTFLACIQTMSAVPELAKYLHEKLKLKYILPGKFTSDPIEGRFGWYRQANGGNFFMSIKQLLEAEKKIRTLSLIQQQGVIGLTQLNSVNNDISLDCLNGDKSTDGAEWLTEFLLPLSLDDITENDSNVAFYVSGYIGRSISRRRKCSLCKAMLVKSDISPALPLCECEEYSKLFELVSRGGLSVPTELCFVTTVLAVQCYTAVITEDYAKLRLMSCLNQQSTFVCAVKNIVERSDHLKETLTKSYSVGHSNLELILQTVFNCFAKNEMKRFNAPRSEPQMMSRTIRKLNGESSLKTGRS